jgi:integrase
MARGFIQKRNGDSYRVAVSLGKDIKTGRYNYQWITVKGKRQAETKLAELLHQVNTGNIVKTGRLKTSEFFERWLSEYAYVNLSPRSFERYRDLIRQHVIPDIGNISLSQLKPEHLQRHYTTKLAAGLSARTIRYHHAVIHKALQTALKWGLILRNPAEAVEAPKPRQTEMKVWTEYEVSQFLKTAKDSPYYSLFYLALFTGMRRSELLGLQWQDVDLVFCQLSIRRSLHHLKDGSYFEGEPKSEKSKRTIALAPGVILMLKAHQTQNEANAKEFDSTVKESDYVFCQPDGRPWRPNTITRAWASTAKRAGVPIIRLHDARHTHASLMLKQGVHPKIVQERLGHNSIEMTMNIYSHIMPGLQEAAAKQFEVLIPIPSY